MTQHSRGHASSHDSNAGHRFIDVQKALKGASYPADKQSLLECARSNGASEEVVHALDGLPEREFANPADVSKGVGNEAP
ncbi:DUF2795 domain-containing protein [Paraburkholderia sp. A1RI-2L]|uniref:DUF2795 domain-containing protein n=1 Tax=Paraburkholderia sp. A1RI-2L TaxID=3028367 RepID=UPI003B7C2BC4